MSVRTTSAVAARVLRQLRRDPRTVALLIVVPTVLVVLLHEVFSGREEVFQRIGAPLLGIFPFISMFLVSSITMLRERVSGTLERLMSMPLAKLDVLVGYAIAFAAVAAAQATIVSLVALGPLGLNVERPVTIVGLAIGNAVLGMSLGLFVSAFARTEFQAVQFMPAFVFPQLLLCGLLVPREQMAGWLDAVSWVLPLTYAYDALARAMASAPLGGRFWADVAVVAGVTIAALVLGAATLRRRTA
ncbi:MAG: ABC transporter permease [Thermoleophilia bacterium]|nr:ABC transporter permease [Thermoleophilia bacterium]MDH4346370.1 ABC transporter permease [Thermoleophilia bacterium]